MSRSPVAPGRCSRSSENRPERGRRATVGREAATNPHSNSAPVSAAAAPAEEKAFRAGTHRSLTPEQTLQWVQPFLPVAGITRVANVTGLDRIGVPVVMVTRPNARSLAVDQGKGITLVAAKVSGIMEALERWHAEHPDLPVLLASLRQLRAHERAVDIDRLALARDGFFTPDLEIAWVQGADLFTGDGVWLPREVVSLDFTLPRPRWSGCFAATRTGIAAGNGVFEAMSHALCEAIERDALTLWHLRSEAARAASRVDAATIDDPDCRDVLARIERAGIDAVMWEITSDIAVPCFLCGLIPRDEVAAAGPLFSAGTGCHPARAIALLRALTEAVQSRLTKIVGSRDDMDRARYALPDPADFRRRRDSLLVERPARAFGEAPSWDAPTFQADVQGLLRALAAAGLDQAIAVDLAKPGIGIPVVRVIVPGLEDGVDTPNYRPGTRAHRMTGLAA